MVLIRILSLRNANLGLFWGNGSFGDEDVLGKAEVVRTHHNFPRRDAFDPSYFAFFSSEDGSYLQHSDLAHSYRHLLSRVRDLGGHNSLP